MAYLNGRRIPLLSHVETGGGAVDSVNGQTGDVVLTASNIDFNDSATIEQVISIVSYTSTTAAQEASAALGAVSVKENKVDFINSVTLDEAATYVIFDKDANGNNFSLKAFDFIVIAPAATGSGTTTGYVGVYKNRSATTTDMSLFGTFNLKNSASQTFFHAHGELFGNIPIISGADATKQVAGTKVAISKSFGSVENFTANAFEKVRIQMNGTDGIEAGTRILLYGVKA